MATPISQASRHAATILAVASGLMFSTNAAEATTASAKERAEQVFSRFQDLGVSLQPNYELGLLPKGGDKIVDVQLYGGTRYLLVGAGCKDARDVDLLVYDERGNLLTYDGEQDPVPMLDFTAPYTGTYYLRIVMYDSTIDGAHWVLMGGYL